MSHRKTFLNASEKEKHDLFCGIHSWLVFEGHKTRSHFTISNEPAPPLQIQAPKSFTGKNRKETWPGWNVNNEKPRRYNIFGKQTRLHWKTAITLSTSEQATTDRNSEVRPQWQDRYGLLEIWEETLKICSYPFRISAWSEAREKHWQKQRCP